ncbi:MAG: ABC transporter permease [Candidatus Bathyarchaeia archaeon]
MINMKIVKNIKQIADLTTATLLLAIISLCIIFCFLSPAFLTISNILTIFRIIPTLLVFALGINCLLIIGEIDLSFTSVANLVGIIIALLSARLNGVIAILISGLIAAGIGLINGLCTCRLRIPSFLTTLGTMVLTQGTAYLISRYRSHPIRTMALQIIFRTPLPGGLDISIFWALGILLIIHFILTRTRFGRYMYAIGGNETAAQLLGLPVYKIKVTLFVINSLMAAIAAWLALGRVVSAVPNFAQIYLMPAIAAAVLGGASLTGGEGSAIKTAVAVILLRLIVQGFNLIGLDPATHDIASGVVLILTLGIRRILRISKQPAS